LIYSLYKQACESESDINQHLPTLREYALQVDHVTEFGIGNSTLAFLCARPFFFHTYDIDPQRIAFAHTASKQYKRAITISHASTLDVSIVTTDLLFIDTWHTYDQLSKELEKHAPRVRRYIIFHDTVSFGDLSEDDSKPGLMQAIRDFQEENLRWEEVAHWKYNNGLLILEKV
jgi:hypothetical protein